MSLPPEPYSFVGEPDYPKENAMPFEASHGKFRGYLTSPLFRDALARAGRTFVYAFAAVLIPGLLGFLHAVTEWAGAQGQTPFPDATSLAYVAVSAIVAGTIAVVNLVGIVVEDATGARPGRQ